MQFEVKTIKNDDILSELKKIGFDPSYIESAAKKHGFLSLKIQNLPPHLATIIKETALSKGCDAGVNRGVLIHSVEFSDLILSGSEKQLEETAKSLSRQPFGAAKIAKRIEEEILLSKKEYNPLIMGILNLTEDSFSDGGEFLDPKKAIIHAEEMLKDGAGIIDIGAESTRPGAEAVPVQIEIERLKPVVKEIKKLGAKISIDTRNSVTAEFALNEGADIINDVSGLEYDRKMAEVIKETGAEVVIMHSRGTPKNMDNLNQYKNLADEVFNSLNKKLEFAALRGIQKEKIIIDVGFGFAKDVGQNFELLKRIKEFNSLGVRQLAGVSRKRFLKSLLMAPSNPELDLLTSISSFYLFENKVDIVRVHNVKETKSALELYKAICLQKPCP